jgi:hypothetical protein
MAQRSPIDKLSQLAIPLLTLGGYALTAVKHPEWGMVVSLCSQPFWLYSAGKARKQAGQSGIFTTAIIMTFILLYGVANYWM